MAKDKKQEVMDRIFSIMRGVASPTWVINEMKRRQGKKRKYAKGGKVKK